MGVGFLDAAGDPNTLLVWPQVGNTNIVEAQFTPIMSAYVTKAYYKQTQIIKGEILSPQLLNQNLAVLPDTQTYIVSMLPSGQFQITPDNA